MKAPGSWQPEPVPPLSKPLSHPSSKSPVFFADSIKVSTKGPASLKVFADPLLLGQALLNLILNAVQASEKGRAVVVEFAGDADEGRGGEG